MDNENNYKGRNPQVFRDLEAIIEKLVKGELKVKFYVFNKRITKVELYGKRHERYNRQSDTSD